MKHAIIIDAGSSGSRAFIYEWPDPSRYLEDLAPNSVLGEALLPVQTHPSRVRKISPGISSFQGRTGDIWKEHLKPLVNLALKEIPSEQHSETPIFFLATAGLRLLPEADRDEILLSVCDNLRSRTPFLIPECSSHVSMISGETEGLYGWLGLNYLVHFNIHKSWNDFSQTYGFLDMGGASAQLAFVPQSSEDSSNLHVLKILTAGGDSVEWKVFVTTWLEFGTNQAQLRFRNQLITEIPGNEANMYKEKGVPIPVSDPCLPIGAIDIYQASNGNTYNFLGSGMWPICEKKVSSILNRDFPCDNDPCLFNGVYVPHFDAMSYKFIGVSEYWYTLHDILGSSGKLEYPELVSNISEVCGRDWNSIKADAKNGNFARTDQKDFTDDDLKKLCFKSTWVYTMLKKGYQFPEASLTTNSDNPFQEHFQSVVEIGGTEISWTLGRAVLYASSQITPTNGDGIVGYTTSNGEFVNGGERLSIDEINKYIQSHSASSNVFPHALIWIIVLVVLITGVARVTTGSFGEIWDAFCSIRIIRRIRKKIKRLIRKMEQQDTSTDIGYGHIFPHAGIPLSNFHFRDYEMTSYQEGTSSLRTASQSPSRVGSRVNLAT